MSTKAEVTTQVGDRAPVVRRCPTMITKGHSQCFGRPFIPQAVIKSKSVAVHLLLHRPGHTRAKPASALVGWTTPTNPKKAILPKAVTHWSESGEENLGSGRTLSTGCLPIVRDLRPRWGESSAENIIEGEALCECKAFLDTKKVGESCWARRSWALDHQG